MGSAIGGGAANRWVVSQEPPAFTRHSLQNVILRKRPLESARVRRPPDGSPPGFARTEICVICVICGF
ncbi:MAG: hypothetical protein C5B58_13605 [Acidobacteria bacterium]|nr:MAG: hypothetical protein C5B58_13605 [Acidobacteriota bacterium]